MMLRKGPERLSHFENKIEGCHDWFQGFLLEVLNGQAQGPGQTLF